MRYPKLTLTLFALAIATMLTVMAELTYYCLKG